MQELEDFTPPKILQARVEKERVVKYTHKLDTDINFTVYITYPPCWNFWNIFSLTNFAHFWQNQGISKHGLITYRNSLRVRFRIRLIPGAPPKFFFLQILNLYPRGVSYMQKIRVWGQNSARGAQNKVFELKSLHICHIFGAMFLGLRIQKILPQLGYLPHLTHISEWFEVA